MGRPETLFELPIGRELGTAQFLFVLMPGFSAMDVGTGTDILETANKVGAEGLSFDWQIISETGEPVRSSSGLVVSVEAALPDHWRGDFVVLCGPPDECPTIGKPLRSWLRRVRRQGATICALGGAAHVLAETGLAQGRRLSTHWMLHPVMVEAFPEVEVGCTVFEQDRSILSSGGQAATLDMFMSVIEQFCGAERVSAVADRILCSGFRNQKDRQTRTNVSRVGLRHQKLALALARIEENIEDPLSPADIAGFIGLSTRQLERLFQRHIGVSPKNYITGVRLDRARLLLNHSNMRVIDVAMACGFTSPSHFSKLYRKKFGTSPHSEQGVLIPNR